MGEVLGKALLGAGLGGLGGAFGGDPGALHTFVGGTGETGIEGGGPISVDPGDLLAQGFGQLGTMRNAFADRLAQGTEMGPASIVQTPAYAYGGALPAPLGITVSDPGFLQRPGIELPGYSPVGPGGTGLGNPSGIFPPGWNEDDSTPGGGGGGDNPPRDPRYSGGADNPWNTGGTNNTSRLASSRIADAGRQPNLIVDPWVPEHERGPIIDDPSLFEMRPPAVPGGFGNGEAPVPPRRGTGGFGGRLSQQQPSSAAQMLRPLSPLGGGASAEAAMLRFADAANILRMKQGQPLQAPGGFS